MLSARNTFNLALCLFCAVALIAASACENRGGNNPQPTEPDITFKISIVSGNFQTGPLETELANPLRVFVSDQINVKQVAVVVNFTIIEGRGDLSFPSAVTDVDGFCEVSLTPTDSPGTIMIEAEVKFTDVNVTFTATGV